MIIILVFLSLLFLAVKFEAPIQVLAKVILWFMLIQSGTLAAKATWNQLAPMHAHYLLPLYPIEIAELTRATVQGVPGVTRSQSGNISGLKMDLSGTVENRTDRTIDKVVVQCQVNAIDDDEGQSFSVDVPVRIPPKSAGQFQYTWKARNNVQPGNLAAATHHCYVERVEEVNLWK